MATGSADRLAVSMEGRFTAAVASMAALVGVDSMVAAVVASTAVAADTAADTARSCGKVKEKGWQDTLPAFFL